MITTKVYANLLAIQSGSRLNAERLRRVVEAKSLDDAFKMLGDYGYAYSEGCTVDGFIVGETNRLIEFIEDNAASDKFGNALLARFVYNNAKLAYKSRFHSVPSDGYYRVAFDAVKIADGDYSDADKFMREALESLDEAQERDPQKIDLTLTRAMYKSVLSCGIPNVKKFFRAEIDMKNILSAARMRRLGMDEDEFIEGGRVSKDVLRRSVTEDGFADCYDKTPYFEYAENIENGEFGELWRAEREADDYLFFMTYADVANINSYEPFLNYYAEALVELKTAKIALVCVKTAARETFYKRLSAVYKD